MMAEEPTRSTDLTELEHRGVVPASKAERLTQIIDPLFDGGDAGHPGSATRILFGGVIGAAVASAAAAFTYVLRLRSRR